MNTRILAVLVALQVAWVGATVVRQERALATGTLIHLECRPVDPRDLIRGDYVILSYDISTGPESLLTPPLPPGESMPAGVEVWAELQSDGQFHRLARIHRHRTTPDPGNVLLKGRTDRSWRSGDIRILYGLERYYVREGTGNPRGKLTADVSVPASAQGLIQQVYVDGRPYAEATAAGNETSSNEGR